LWNGRICVTAEVRRRFNQGILLSIRLQFERIGNLAHRIASTACCRDTSFVVLNDVGQFVSENSICFRAPGRYTAASHVDIASFGKRFGLQPCSGIVHHRAGVDTNVIEPAAERLFERRALVGWKRAALSERELNASFRAARRRSGLDQPLNVTISKPPLQVKDVLRSTGHSSRRELAPLVLIGVLLPAAIRHIARLRRPAFDCWLAFQRTHVVVPY
jgi:hypothetical protein